VSTVVSIRYERSNECAVSLFRCFAVSFFVCSLVLSLEDVQRKNGLLEQRLKNDKVETKGKE